MVIWWTRKKVHGSNLYLMALSYNSASARTTIRLQKCCIARCQSNFKCVFQGGAEYAPGSLKEILKGTQIKFQQQKILFLSE